VFGVSYLENTGGYNKKQNMHYHGLKQTYYDYLPVFFTGTTMLGLSIGTLSVLNLGYRPVYPLFIYMTIVGYTGIGMVTGLTYPVSYPLMGGFIVYAVGFKNLLK